MARGIIVEVTGLEDIDALLSSIEDTRGAKKILAKANAEGAKFLKPKVKAKTPLGPGHFGYHLRRRVVRGPAKRDKPAAIVKYRDPRDHFLLLGTRPHRIRFHDEVVRGVGKKEGSIQHPGATAYPVMSIVAKQYGNQALDRVEKYLVRAFGLD